MKRTWTIIGVADVPRSFKWYQSLLGLPETAPAHDYFGQIVDQDGTVLLCLHEWGAHEHPSLTSPHYAKPGNGLLLFFQVDNFDVVWDSWDFPCSVLAFPTKRWRRTTQQLLRLEGRVIHQLSL